MIDWTDFSWEDSRSHVLINPSHPLSEQVFFQQILNEAKKWPGHIWLSTSGSSVKKWVGLSKEAILASAQGVNAHLESDRTDRWVNALPFFHVGGLGIWARAFLSGAQVYDYKKSHPKWRAEDFYVYLNQAKGTLTSLVPAQLFDLAALDKTAPESVRAVIVGGGALSADLYARAVALGWPVLPSYGMTECASQAATAKLGSWKEGNNPKLNFLPHLKGQNQNGRICLSGPSLLSVYAFIEANHFQFIDPKVNGWFITEDRGNVEANHVEFFGRSDEVIKVGGENVDLGRLELLLQSLRLQKFRQLQVDSQTEMTLLAFPDDRLGHSIHLVCARAEEMVKDHFIINLEKNASSRNEIMDGIPKEIQSIIEEFQQIVLPFERIRKIYFISEFPRSPIGKILKKELQLLF